jgi:hypothetical protein
MGRGCDELGWAGDVDCPWVVICLRVVFFAARDRFARSWAGTRGRGRLGGAMPASRNPSGFI